MNFCTYCIIPYARGPVRSLPLETAVEQTVQLCREGYREIVLTGIEISSWGRDLKTGESLIDLMEAVCRAAGPVRIRLGSLEPRTITEDFCRRAAAIPNLCPQFHLSLQSGCDETLRRMNRKYDTARYVQSVELLNQYFEHPAIYHGPHHRVSGGDGRGVFQDAFLPGALRIRPDAHLPLLHPVRASSRGQTCPKVPQGR